MASGHKFEGRGQAGYYDGESAIIYYCTEHGNCKAVQYTTSRSGGSKTSAAVRQQQARPQVALISSAFLAERR